MLAGDKKNRMLDKEMSEFHHSLPPISDDDPYMKFFPFVDKAVNILYHQLDDGIENIPVEGPAIILGNHLHAVESFTTPALIARKLGRRTIFAAKQSYFEGGVTLFGRHIRSPRAYFFQDVTHAIPVARNGKRESIQEFQDAAVNVLEQGELLAGYPEGTRSPDGRLYKYRNGFANVALAAHVPIIPQGNVYMPHIGPDPRRIAITHFGKPIMPEEYEDMKPFELSELVRTRVQLLTGQELADTFAPTGKEEKKKFILDLKRGAK